MKTKISARIILDSITDSGQRLTTVEAVFHRYILSEVNTHRVFSRNSASSRAIPIQKQIHKVLHDLAIPVEWGANQSGMQAKKNLSGWRALAARTVWRVASWAAVGMAYTMWKIGVHKQITNRLLEPFMWHTAIISSTEFENFFRQRDSELAQPEIQVLARCIKKAMEESTPKMLGFGKWHTPYIRDDEQDLDINIRLMVSAARCARVSYLTQDGRRDIHEDVKLFERLVTASPEHWSPTEHVATPSLYSPELGNFGSWSQLRHHKILKTLKEELSGRKTPPEERVDKPLKV